MTAATRSRLRAAVIALPVAQRERHLSTLAMLLHLVEHVREDSEPIGFVAGRAGVRSPELRWAAEQLGYALHPCPDPSCSEPGHVTITTQPLATSRRRNQ